MSLRTLSPVVERAVGADVRCIAVLLAHNEALRIEDFLRHHRALGIGHFVIVDDRSTDATRTLIEGMPDVSVYEPNGTTYKQHKAQWRAELGARYGAGRWLLFSDIDELLVYPGCESRPLGRLLDHLEAQGAEALFTPMVDMYAAEALDRSAYRRGESMLEHFPWFDGDGFRLAPPSSKHLRRFPTPGLDLLGGTRERLFERRNPPNAFQRWLIRRFQGLDRTLMPGPLEAFCLQLVNGLVKRRFPRPPLVMSKVPLVRWRDGMAFPGGPHSLTPRVALGDVWGALLHFKYIDVAAETAYKAARGQHAKGSVHYHAMLAQPEKFARPALYEGSRRYRSSADLLACGLLRSSPAWEAP
ncbi:glycosyltransferase family 2 protein [Zavarzinia sp.]|uniref:glycosyltransferase family 2 protein n=1 Tax=Zavarzinia sp. TaxID=2027920 RepID=UPI003567DC9F